jgi:hypothetical protein
MSAGPAKRLLAKAGAMNRGQRGRVCRTGAPGRSGSTAPAAEVRSREVGGAGAESAPTLGLLSGTPARWKSRLRSSTLVYSRMDDLQAALGRSSARDFEDGSAMELPIACAGLL